MIAYIHVVGFTISIKRPSLRPRWS